MTFKVQCVKVARRWGGYSEYEFEAIGEQPASTRFQVGLYDEQDSFKLGESYEMKLG